MGYFRLGFVLELALKLIFVFALERARSHASQLATDWSADCAPDYQCSHLRYLLENRKRLLEEASKRELLEFVLVFPFVLIFAFAQQTAGDVSQSTQSALAFQTSFILAFKLTLEFILAFVSCRARL